MSKPQNEPPKNETQASVNAIGMQHSGYYLGAIQSPITNRETAECHIYSRVLLIYGVQNEIKTDFL